MPNTLAEDGDPVDVLVVTNAPLMSGVVIPCRPIGMLHMDDEAGGDAGILPVPTTRLAPLCEEVRDCTDVARSLRDGNAHSFEQYEALELGRWARVDHWSGADEAKAEIVACVERFKNRAA